MVPKTLLSLIENSEYLKTVSDLYSSNGYEFYLVGGAVRDGILDIETTDFDFTTNASPEESIDLLNNKNQSLGIKELLIYNIIFFLVTPIGTIFLISIIFPLFNSQRKCLQDYIFKTKFILMD